jgi:hypothetical protein
MIMGKYSFLILLDIEVAQRIYGFADAFNDFLIK